MTVFAADILGMTNTEDMVLIETKTETLEDGATMLTELFVSKSDSGIQPYATSQTIDASVHATVTKESNTCVFYLYARFNYDGTTSTCIWTSATQHHGSPFNVTYCGSSKTKNIALGTYIYTYNSGTPTTLQLSMSCSVTGQITS